MSFSRNKPHQASKLKFIRRCFNVTQSKRFLAGTLFTQRRMRPARNLPRAIRQNLQAHTIFIPAVVIVNPRLHKRRANRRASTSPPIRLLAPWLSRRRPFHLIQSDSKSLPHNRIKVLAPAQQLGKVVDALDLSHYVSTYSSLLIIPSSHPARRSIPHAKLRL